MSAQRGKDILLKIEGEGGAFTTVAGLRARLEISVTPEGSSAPGPRSRS